MLSKAVESVLAQERLPDQIVVVLDHEGVGAAQTKERALESINTQFVAVLDSDDWFLPNHLSVLEAAQLETRADLVYSWFQTDPPGGDPFPESFFTDPWDPNSPRHTTTTIMARTDMMKKVGYKASDVPGHPFSEDDWLMTMGLINLGAKVHHVAERTWVWHHHGENTSGLPVR